MLTNKQVNDLAIFINSEECKSLELSVKGYMKLKKLVALIPPFIKDLQEAESEYRKPSEAFVKFEEEKLKVVSPFVVCDGEGKPLMDESGNITIIEGKQGELQKVLTKHHQENEEVVSAHNAKLLEWFNFFNNEKAMIDLPLLTEDEITLPEKGTAELFDNLSLLVSGLFDEEEETPDEETKEDSEE